jgi:hypothetical protein
VYKENMYQLSIALLLLLSFCYAPTLAYNAHEHNNNNNNNNQQHALVNFDINQCYTQLMYAYSAYCPKDKLEPWKCYFCNYNVSDTGGFVVSAVMGGFLTDTYAYVGSRGKTAEVVFRGTTNFENWIANADFSHVSPYANLPGSFVHQGFYTDYLSLAPTLKSALNTLIAHSNVTEVYFTGHSLGAALATLAAYDIAPTLRIPSGIYTFGSPRVGNKVFTDAFYKLFPNSFRVTNMDDPVPHLPPTDLGYHHVAQEVWWNKPTTYKICDTTGEDPKCADSTILKHVDDHLDYLNIPVHSVNNDC